MWPLELTATPAASPMFKSGGSLRKFGTESKGICGTDCAKAAGLSSTKAATNRRFTMTSLDVFSPIYMGKPTREACLWGCGRRVRDEAARNWTLFTMDAPAPKSKLIKGATGDWEVVVGLEVHAHVTSQAKLF